LQWQDGVHGAVNSVTLDLTITNDAGVLGRICTLIGEQSANISDLKFIERKPDYYRLMMDIDVGDVEHFHRVQTALEADSNVSSIGRHRDPGLANVGRQET
jgi:GTP pyrophosphokinase